MLPAGSVVPQAAAAAISSAVSTWNARIRKIASAAEASLTISASLQPPSEATGSNRQQAFDCQLSRRLYSLNGYYPSHCARR